MAEISGTNETTMHRSVLSWTGATNGGTPDTFTPVELARIPYAIIMQVTGDFSGSAAIALHGSVDGTNYAALNDRSGSAISLTAAGLANVGDAPRYLKPVMTSGDGSADLDVTILVWHESR